MSEGSARSLTTYYHHHLHIALHRERSANIIKALMATKVSSRLSFTTDGLGMLVSVAEAVPVLGAPVKGSVEALKQIYSMHKYVHPNDDYA
jgi:hypothetical protein